MDKNTDNFWTDELVKEFTLGAIKLQNSLPNEVSLDRGLYHFKKEKSKKEEPQQVEENFKVEGLFLSSAPGKDWVYKLHLNKLMHHEKQSELKNIIERYLNGEMNNPAPKEEPQWEILEFKSNDGNLLVLDGKKWKYRNDTNSISDIDFLIKNYAIHSVKRLSDGEVFSVGDSLDWMGKIESIEIDDRFNGGIAFINNSQKSCISTAKKAPKEEQVPIKVEIMEFGYGKPQENKGKFYVANFNLPNNAKLPTEKYQSIKSAIEDVLNGKQEKIDNYISLKKVVKDFLDEKFPKLYTESELLLSRREGFDAGRAKYPTAGFKYDTFEDYINSLK